jgi:hypothetical protein
VPRMYRGRCDPLFSGISADAAGIDAAICRRTRLRWLALAAELSNAMQIQEKYVIKDINHIPSKTRSKGLPRTGNATRHGFQRGGGGPSGAAGGGPLLLLPST